MRLYELEKTSVINQTDFNDPDVLIGFEIECLLKDEGVKSEKDFFKLPNWFEIACGYFFTPDDDGDYIFYQIDISRYKKYFDKKRYAEIEEEYGDYIDIYDEDDSVSKYVVDVLKNNPKMLKEYISDSIDITSILADISYIKDSLKNITGMNIEGNGTRKEWNKKSDRYYLDDDSSITDERGFKSLEIVSPPLPATVAFEHLSKIRNFIHENGKVNDSCGVHINISRGKHKIDPIKLILFTGSKYILELVGRTENDYIEDYNIDKLVDNNKISSYTKEVLRSHYGVVNNENDDYFSFRHLGAETFMNNFQQTMKIVKSFVRNIIIASTTMYDKEYKTMMYKITQKNKKENKTSYTINIYSRKIPGSFDIKGTKIDDILTVSNSNYRRSTKNMKTVWCGFKKTPSTIIELPSDQPSDVVKKFFELKYKAEPSKVSNI